MKFKVTKNGKTTILKLGVKKLDATVTPELKAEFLILCKPAVTEKLIVDLETVEFCDSSGLSALLIADRTMVFDLSKLSGKFSIRCEPEDTVAAVIQSMDCTLIF